MSFTIIFLYETGKKEIEDKSFGSNEIAGHWADKEKIERGAYEVYVL